MNRLARLSLLPAACAFAAACASAAPRPPRDEPPEMVSRGASPNLRIPTSAMVARTALEVNIEVLIDENGSPDMSTFKVTGIGAEDNRDALARWIEQARFRPAQRGGEAVPGIYRTSIRARVEVRRISPD